MYETTINENQVRFYPLSELEEIQQNIVTILSTAIGNVPCDRGIGIDMSALDQPMEVASALIAAATIEAIESFETRVVVRSVTTTYNADGQLVPVVRWELAEQAEEVGEH